MVFSFIGFSGCGKSHVARRFATELGWNLISCDDRIEEALEPILPQQVPHGTQRVAHWLGQPYTSGFSERQQLYLEAEQEALYEICLEAERCRKDENLVIDTTGSVIYMSRESLISLRARSYVFYFEMPDSDEEAMFEQYLQDPKPVIWQDLYHHDAQEDQNAALRKCYPVLMHQRAAMYEKMADFTVSAAFADRADLNPQTLIGMVRLP